jgi:hypothetical protein
VQVIENNGVIVGFGSFLLCENGTALAVDSSGINLCVLNKVGKDPDRLANVGTQGLGTKGGLLATGLGRENTTYLGKLGSLSLFWR